MIYWRRDLWAAGILAGGIAIALVIHFVLFLILKRLASRKGDVVIKSLVRHSQGPSLWIFRFLPFSWRYQLSHCCKGLPACRQSSTGKVDNK
jgi:uncharacterized membrane protein required for colicin V production